MYMCSRSHQLSCCQASVGPQSGILRPGSGWAPKGTASQDFGKAESEN